MAMAVLAKLANVAWHMGLGPQQSVALGQLNLCTKSSCKQYFVSRNFRKMTNLVKCIEKYLLVGKLRMTYQNVQKNMLYILVSISCIVKQLEPCPK
jgi:predicted transglutaminase-like protease